MNATSEVQPHLIVWQVGINDALAQAEVAPFAEALDEVLRWAHSHEIDTALVEPPYTAALASDDHFKELIAAISLRSPIAVPRRAKFGGRAAFGVRSARLAQRSELAAHRSSE
jgi:hypothetical protein